MSMAARLMLLGMLLVAAAIGLYLGVGWEETFARHPHWVRPTRGVLRPLLRLAWYGAFTVPALLLVGTIYRFATVRLGRALVVWKLFAYVTLWALGSFAFFFGLFLVYMPDFGSGGIELLVPAVWGCLGYLVLGLGFVASVLQR